MCSTGNQEEFLVLRARRFTVTLLGHVECVGKTSGNHQQRLIDKVHTFTCIECEKVDQAAFGVAECRIGMRMALEIILVAITIEVEREFCRLFRRHAAHIACIFHLPAFGFFLTGGASIGKSVLHLKGGCRREHSLSSC